MGLKLEGVQETMLIPLASRALETRAQNPRVVDEKAVELVNKLDYDFTKFEKRFSKEGVIARTLILDRETQKFINHNPNGICIEIGCGLNTRYDRLNTRQVAWYNLDFPNVIKIRRALLYEGRNVRCIAASALDSEWTKKIDTRGKNVLIIMEGLLMYFSKEEVVQLLCIIKEHFPGCTILAEIMHPFVAKQSKHHDTVKNTSAVFKWGVRSGKEMEELCNGLICKCEWNLFDELKEEGMLFKIVSAIPFIRNRNNKIVKLGFYQ